VPVMCDFFLQQFTVAAYACSCWFLLSKL